MRHSYLSAGFVFAVSLAGCSSDKASSNQDGGAGAGATNTGAATGAGGKTATGGTATTGSGGKAASAGGGTGAGGTSAGGGGNGGSASGGGAGTGGGGAVDPVAPCSICADGVTCTNTGAAASGSGLAAKLAAKLGKSNFLVGMGNDLNNDHNQDAAYTLGSTFDAHYAYLVGLPGQGGWPDWNANGDFVKYLAEAASRHCVTPMYTLYMMASIKDGNLSGLSDAAFMTPYWAATKLLFQQLKAFDKPSIVHVEPDFWAYAQQQSKNDPANYKVVVKALVPECAEQPDTLVGFGHCMIKLARQMAPKALIGFHASEWAGSPADMLTFFKAVGATDGDAIFMDVLDRDAGCYEAHVDPHCQNKSSGVYWDESNQTSPNFHEHLAYAKQIADGLSLPIMWWQVPFGVPSSTPGGTKDHYRDNRVHYIFNHIDEFVAAGGVGVTFGVGDANQTTWTTDNDQFKNAAKAYFAKPTPLP